MSVTRLDVSLEQYEIGLSRAAPHPEDWSEPAMDRGILAFVSLVSGIVFKYGGRIVHGCHPSFTPVLLRQARRYRETIGSADRLALAVSRHWSKEMPADDLHEWRKDATVQETPEAEAGDNQRDES